MCELISLYKNLQEFRKHVRSFFYLILFLYRSQFCFFANGHWQFLSSGPRRLPFRLPLGPKCRTITFAELSLNTTLPLKRDLENNLSARSFRLKEHLPSRFRSLVEFLEKMHLLMVILPNYFYIDWR